MGGFVQRGYSGCLGVGIALAAKRRGDDYRVFVLLGDGECNEGSIWEAAMSAVRFGLDNLIVIVDVNGQQLDGYSTDVMPLHDLPGIFRGFGFHVEEVDGHDIEQLYSVLQTTAAESPTAIVAHTIKGKGIREIEGKTGWHHTTLTQEQYEAFMESLKGGK